MLNNKERKRILQMGKGEVHPKRKDFSNLSEEEIDLQEEEKFVHIANALTKICTQRMCKCKNSPIIKTAPPACKLIPKSPYGISVWVYLLVEKYQSIGSTITGV